MCTVVRLYFMIRTVFYDNCAVFHIDLMGKDSKCRLVIDGELWKVYSTLFFIGMALIQGRIGYV